MCHLVSNWNQMLFQSLGHRSLLPYLSLACFGLLRGRMFVFHECEGSQQKNDMTVQMIILRIRKMDVGRVWDVQNFCACAFHLTRYDFNIFSLFVILSHMVHFSHFYVLMSAQKSNMDGLVVGKPNSATGMSHSFWRLVTTENFLQRTYVWDRLIVSNEGYDYGLNSIGWGKQAVFVVFQYKGHYAFHDCSMELTVSPVGGNKLHVCDQKWQLQKTPAMGWAQRGNHWVWQNGTKSWCYMHGANMPFVKCEEEVSYESTLFQLLRTRIRAT